MWSASEQVTQALRLLHPLPRFLHRHIRYRQVRDRHGRVNHRTVTSGSLIILAGLVGMSSSRIGFWDIQRAVIFHVV